MDFSFVAWIGFFTSVALVVIGVITYKTRSPDMKILAWFFGVELVVDILTLYLATNGINNHVVYHVKRLFEYSAFAFVLTLWQTRRYVARIIGGTIPTFVVLWIVAKLFVEDVREFDSFTSSLASVLLVFASSYTFVSLVDTSLNAVSRDPRFWIVSGILLLHATRILLFALGNFVLRLPLETFMNLWALHWFAAILANIFFVRAFLCRQPILTSSGR